MKGKYKFTFLGTGTSQGVPVIACKCHVCASNNSKDNRLRSSLLVSINGENYVVDTGPDFRQQMLVNDVQTVNGILFTHEHKDHVAGLDDVRAYNYSMKEDMQIYCSEAVGRALHQEFHYIFADTKYPGVPHVNINLIENKPFSLNGYTVVPIQIMHYRMPVFGYRFEDFTYITDAKTISSEERDKIRGTKVLVVNALRKEEHISHFNLKEALDFINDINPESAYLTHISHLFGTHDEIQRLLPENVFVAYDGLVINMD